MNPTPLEYFAAHETLAEYDHPESCGVNLKFCESIAGPRPAVGSWDSQPIWEWEAKWRAKLRFIRAKAMVEEAERTRKESEPKDHVWADMVHPLFNTPQWGDYVRQNWERIRGMQNTAYTVPSKTTCLSFSEALEAMKLGKKVRRSIPNMASIWIHEGRVISGIGRVASFLPEAVLANDWDILPEEPK